MSKYHAMKYRGYDSKREANRALHLKLLAAAGEISDLREQVRYELIPAQWVEEPRVGKNGQPLKPHRRCAERSCEYIADFVYKDKNGNEIVEDAKGVRTPEYRIKRKLMLWVHGIRVKEV